MELAQRVIHPPRASEGNVFERLRRTASAHAALVMEQLPYRGAEYQELEMHLLERTNEGERAELAQVRMRPEADEALYIRVIKEGIRSGEPRAVNLRLVARSLLGVLNRTLRWLYTHEGESGAGRMAESIGEFLGGLA